MSTRPGWPALVLEMESTPSKRQRGPQPRTTLPFAGYTQRVLVTGPHMNDEYMLRTPSGNSILRDLSGKGPQYGRSRHRSRVQQSTEGSSRADVHQQSVLRPESGQMIWIVLLSSGLLWIYYRNRRSQ
jgi:hypothetical protein